MEICAGLSKFTNIVVIDGDKEKRGFRDGGWFKEGFRGCIWLEIM